MAWEGDLVNNTQLPFLSSDFDWALQLLNARNYLDYSVWLHRDSKRLFYQGETVGEHDVVRLTLPSSHSELSLVIDELIRIYIMEYISVGSRRI